jgi:uncharacterized protein involved in exopolysaccharide biosynthesis
MYQTFDAFEYLQYLRRRWRVIAVACGVAIALALPVSLLMPKRYTAVATIVIEPPGGGDPRTPVVVSPSYLESLKAYERFASDDRLFARAAEKFRLQDPAAHRPIESLKRAMLKVNKVRDTRILEVSVTLKDPKLAQSVAEYLATETVAMSHGESLDADREFTEEAEKNASAARARVQQLEQAWTKLSANEPVDSLQGELDSAVELQAKLRQQLVDTDATIAEYQDQGKIDSGFAREQLQAARSRKTLLEKRIEELGKSISELGVTISSRNAKRDGMQNEVRLAQTAAETAEKHLGDLRAMVGTRGERLRVVDPGIVPERPSSPNISLNIAAALFVALLASITYLSFIFVLPRKMVGFEPEVTRGLRR